MAKKKNNVQTITTDQIDIRPELISQPALNGLARVTLAAVKEAFKQPEVRADFEAWQRDRQNKKQ